MKLKLILATAIVGVALALPSVSNAAPPPPPPPQLDTVSGTARFFSGCTDMFNCGIDVDIDAHSGPSGENPSGVVVITSLVMPFPGDLERGQSFTSPVTCLNVQGNRATIGTSASLAIGPFLTTVEDNGGAGLDRFSVTRVVTVPTQCPAPPAPGSGGLVADGHFAVHDATPLPTTKDQCKNGGWHNYPQFKNQGQCIAFVNHGP